MDRDRLLADALFSVFLACSLFFVSVLSLRILTFGFPLSLLSILGLLAIVAALALAAVRMGVWFLGATALLLVLGLTLSAQSVYAASLAVQLMLLTFPFMWLRFYKKRGMGEALSELGFTGRRLLLNVVLGVVVTIFLLYPLVIAEVMVLENFFGVTDIGNVSRVIEEAPWWLLLFSFTIAPVAEETFFRAFLQPRLGIQLTTVLFALAHYSYGSVAEFIGALTIGLLFAVMYERTRSIASVASGHAVFNLISISVVYLQKLSGA